MKKGSGLILEAYKNHNEYNRLFNNHKNFGGFRKAVLERDNFSCVKCKLTQEGHFDKYGRDITVDHIDRDRKNNTLFNLQTLCLKCHGKKDARQSYRDRSSLSSKYQGVCWNKSEKKWAAYFYVDRKQHFVGYFDDALIAKETRDNLFNERMSAGEGK